MNTNRERPIIFSGPMVRAILEGRKTQTRRVILPQPDENIVSVDHILLGGANRFRTYKRDAEFGEVTTERDIFCRWEVGDLLWVREAWAPVRNGYAYRADYSAQTATQYKWESPICMRRYASRLTLQVTDVRADGVQEITVDDLYAEGCPHISSDEDASELYEWYSDLWDSLNAKRGYSWESNPWVWVISFERVKVEKCCSRLKSYPENWDEIANRVKEEADGKCERCGHAHDRASGHVLTTHHLDGDPSNCERWNLAALCQRCHLHIQAKVKFEQGFMFEHSEWFKPHLEGYLKAKHDSISAA